MRYKNYLFSLWVLLLSAALLPAQSLQISSRSPEKNQNYVDRQANITIQFDQNIIDSTLHDSTLIIRGSQSGKLSGLYSGGGSSTISFNPENDFHAGEVISVTITQKLRSESGIPLSHGYTYSFTVASAAATPLTLAQRSLTGASSQARDIQALDYDHDGDLDILTATEGVPERIYLYENNGNVDAATSYWIGSLKYVEVYDIDGDGDFDNIGTNGNESAIYWFENEGNPPYSQHTIANSNVWSTTAGDLDSDGDIDVLGAILRLNPVSHRLYWYANEDTGSFADGVEITSSFDGGSDSYFKIKDINSDGAMDILAFHKEGTNIVWYENNDMTFSEHLIKNMPEWGRLASADIDDDGDIDIVYVSAVNAASSPISWFENNGSESFTEHPITTSATNRLHAANITDLDGDQDMDILAGAYWFENDGSEGFTEHTISIGLNYSSGINYADMDNDGDLDVLTNGPYSVNWHENTAFMDIIATTPANATRNVDADEIISIMFDQNIETSTATTDNIRVFSQTQGYLAGVISGGGTNVIIFNPDSDFMAGDRIEVSVNENVKSTAGHSLPFNYGFTFTAQSLPVDQPDFSSHIIDTLENNVTGMDIADIDGDGDLDLVSCSWIELSWYKNDGSGNFTNIPITISETPVAVFAFDQNEDGHMDIWVDYNGSTSSAVFLNDGNENFTENSVVGSIRTNQLTDVNLDGDLDIVYLGRTNQLIYWLDYSSNGYGGWGSIPALTSNDVQIADMDNDGDNDIISATNSGPLSYENNGYFTFFDKAIAANKTNHVFLSDLDNDTDLDPIFMEDNDAVVWYENISTSDSLHFGQRQVIDSLILDYNDFIAADIDGDGDQDIAAVSGFDDKVVWFANRLNEATNDFGPEQFGVTTTNSPSKILSGDLDNDGDIDLLTLSENDDELTWFENSGGISAIENHDNTPLTFRLDQNYPNPFNPETKILFELPKAGEVVLEIFNLTGQKVRTLLNKQLQAGSQEVDFNAAGLASGIYFYRLTTPQNSAIKRMLLIK